MNWMRPTTSAGRSRLRGAAALMAVLFLLLATFAASPALHQLIHSDANAPGHSCAITALAQGQIDAPVGDSFLILAPVGHSCVTPVYLSVCGVAVELLPPGRAPPAFVS